MRKAFDATLADPAFIADAQRRRLELRAVDGGQLADLVNTVIETPADVREKVKLAIQPKAAQPATGQGHSAIPRKNRGRKIVSEENR